MSYFVPIRPGVYILIGAGGLVMLVGFFGCCGAVRESQCLLGSVSTNVLECSTKAETDSWKTHQTLSAMFIVICEFLSVLCLLADHLWR